MGRLGDFGRREALEELSAEAVARFTTETGYPDRAPSLHDADSVIAVIHLRHTRPEDAWVWNCGNSLPALQGAHRMAEQQPTADLTWYKLVPEKAAIGTSNGS